MSGTLEQREADRRDRQRTADLHRLADAVTRLADVVERALGLDVGGAAEPPATVTCRHTRTTAPSMGTWTCLDCGAEGTTWGA